MALFLRDYLGTFFTPTPLIGILVIIGLGLSLYKKKHAKYFLLSASVLFFIFSTNPIPEYLLNRIEMIYPAYKKDLKQIKFVVVLAGGIAPYAGHPLATQLTVPTLGRLVEGIKIHKENPGSKLVVTGKGWATIPEAEMMKELAVALGVKAEEIIAEKESLNTIEHTKYLKPILKDENFILVTSALHLPRAMKLFYAAGYRPIPAPCQHVLSGEYQFFNIGFPFNSGENLAAMDEWFMEFWATRWAELREII